MFLQVIYRVLNPVKPIGDPYSEYARYLLKITNLRIRMWDPQICPSCLNTTLTDSRALTQLRLTSIESNDAHSGQKLREEKRRIFQRFAIYDLIIRGTCFCNGHADTCVPLRGDGSDPADEEQLVVSCYLSCLVALFSTCMLQKLLGTALRT